MFDQIITWIDNRVAGAFLYGPSQTGKTTAVRKWLPQLISEHYEGGVSAFSCTFVPDKYHGQTAFLKCLCDAVGHQYRKASRSYDLTTRLTSFFVVHGSASGLQQVVLILDEAQYLTENEYLVLCNLQNTAKEFSVHISVIAVGTTQLTYNSTAIGLSHNTHLAARFMARRARFRGIGSKDELYAVLRSYDEDTEWPAGSGVSYTAYFFSSGFAKGLRLCTYAGEMWSAFKKAAPPVHRDALEIPMECVSGLVEWLCRRSGQEEIEVIDSALLERAVEQIDFADIMRVNGPPKPER